MVKKFTDLKSTSVNISKNRFWNRSKNSTSKNSLFKFGLILLSVFVLLNLIAVGIEGRSFLTSIKNISIETIDSLQIAKTQAKFADFETAQEQFLIADRNFKKLASDTWFLKNSFSSIKNLTQAGELISESGLVLTKIATEFKDLPQQFIEANANYLQDPNKQKPSSSLTSKIAYQLPSLTLVHSKLMQAESNLKQINTTVLPTSLTNQIDQAQADLANLNKTFADLLATTDTILDLLGHKVPHTYLVLVQNNYEIRPTGGFFGSVIFAEIDNGILTEFRLEDIYKYDGLLVQDYVDLPPEFQGLKDFNALWIRDANFNPNFKYSAKLIERMLQTAGAPSSDTVIAVNQGFIEDILVQVGDVNLSRFETPITAENYFTVLTYFIEAEQNINPDDKIILKDFIENFEKKIFASTDFKSLFGIFSANLTQKNIQLFSKKPDIQKLIEQLNFSGQKIQPKPNQDYFLLTGTSVGGNKSDRYIKQRVIHNTTINQNHQVLNTVTVRRFHSFTESTEFGWRNTLAKFGVDKLADPVRYVLGRGDNVTKLKMYVPADTDLVGFKGLKTEQIRVITDTEQGTYILFEMRVKPGQTSEVSITYDPKIKLKPNPANKYELLIQKQSGIDDLVFEKSYNLKSNKQKILRHSPEPDSLNANGLPTLEFVLNQDTNLQALYTSF